MEKKQKPFFLNLFKITLPVTAITSLAHRVSGVLLFLSLPFYIYILQLSLRDQAGFDQAAQIMALWPARIVLLLMAWSILHHLLAGIRFLLTDMEVGVEISKARSTAWAVNLGAVVLLLIGAVILL